MTSHMDEKSNIITLRPRRAAREESMRRASLDPSTRVAELEEDTLRVIDYVVAETERLDDLEAEVLNLRMTVRKLLKLLQTGS